MAKFNLVTIRPKGFLHSSAFADVKDSLAWSLTALNHETMLTENAFAAGNCTNILFGAELLPPNGSIPENTIVFNMEQPSHPNMENVRRLSQGHTVWDHSLTSIQDWNQRGFDARHLPIGYTPNLTRIPKHPNQDIDVCFLGWLTPRRLQLIQDLRSRGLNVYSSDHCYGGARDQILSRSKVALNIHHDGRDRFEMVRVSFLLANSKAVVSENSSDDRDYHLSGALLNYPYQELVDKCVEVCLENTLRSALELNGFDAIKMMDFTVSVDRVLGSPSSPVMTPNKILARYKSGCESGDMKDFLPTLRGLAKGLILEIGVRDGASTSALLLGLEERGGVLTSVDIADCSTLWQHPQWVFLQKDSKQLDLPVGELDLAFIDGDHSPQGFLADLQNCMRWVKPGGLILAHDITPLPNYTNEAAGGDWPSLYVGEQFFAYCREHKLRHFVHPGAWGLGVIVKDLT